MCSTVAIDNVVSDHVILSDDEGVRLIKSGGAVHKKGDDWKESNTGGIYWTHTHTHSRQLTTIIVSTGAQVLTLESLATSSNLDDSIDPFTNRLLEYEVTM